MSDTQAPADSGRRPRSEPKWAAVVNDSLAPMPRRRLKTRDILHQSGMEPSRALVRDFNSPSDIGFEPDADVDLAEGNVFRAVAECESRGDPSCQGAPKLAFVVNDRFEVTIQGRQSGASLRGLLDLPHDARLLRDYESPEDEPIEDADEVVFADGPVFRTDGAHTMETTIIVNGRQKQVTGRFVAFSQIVALAFDPVRTEPLVLYTVAYSRGPQANPEGELLAGGKVKIKNRMVFLVTETDKS